MGIKKVLYLILVSMVLGCNPMKTEYASYDEYPVRDGDLSEMDYTPAATEFSVWAPTASEVVLRSYLSGIGGDVIDFVLMKRTDNGVWQAKIEGDLNGYFYTFDVKVNDQWLGETPGIMAKAVGVNGRRGAILDLKTTNPAGWDKDASPPLNSDADVIIYEVHHRDFSVDPSSGIRNKGKYLALTETGTKNPQGISTGIDHLKELGITHVHLLPSYDFASIDETTLDKGVYNWGYDPQNYNVPEGSYATDPYDPAVRIKEFKEMVQALHQAGIRVVLDVVYNHTFNTEESNFERTVPGYFYRHKADGSFADGSACGNETASERRMMRKFMIESVLHWVCEYHIDGFRFDLMGIHDIETMNQIRAAVNEVDPSIFIYGEGWAAQQPQLDNDLLAMKANTHLMPRIAAFSDEMRDGLRGPFNDNSQGAFLSGLPGHEESIKFGLTGAIAHPQVNNDLVNYSKSPWAAQPTQMISYVSCHDDMCLVDRLYATMPEKTTPEEIVRLDKLAQTFVFASQGVPFIYAGEEVMRDKKGVHNSYNSPDSINVIDWNRKTAYRDVFDYYRGLISLRKAHPAFRMGDADMVRKHLEFLPVSSSNLIAFRLKEHANGDKWNTIIVAFNSNKKAVKLSIPDGKYTIVCRDGKINLQGLGTVSGGKIDIPAQSAVIMHQ